MKKPNSFAKKLFANNNYYENNHVIAVQELMKFTKVTEVTKVMENPNIHVDNWFQLECLILHKCYELFERVIVENPFPRLSPWQSCILYYSVGP